MICFKLKNLVIDKPKMSLVIFKTCGKRWLCSNAGLLGQLSRVLTMYTKEKQSWQHSQRRDWITRANFGMATVTLVPIFSTHQGHGSIIQDSSTTLLQTFHNTYWTYKWRTSRNSEWQGQDAFDSLSEVLLRVSFPPCWSQKLSSVGIDRAFRCRIE